MCCYYSVGIWDDAYMSNITICLQSQVTFRLKNHPTRDDPSDAYATFNAYTEDVSKAVQALHLKGNHAAAGEVAWATAYDCELCVHACIASCKHYVDPRLVVSSVVNYCMC